jgi:hypothetical protein
MPATSTTTVTSDPTADTAGITTEPAGTTTDPTPAPASPSGFFLLSAFGAVTLVKKSAITIPDDVRAALAEVPGMLATMANTFKIHLDLRAGNPGATEADAERFRQYIKAYADEMDLNPYVPVFVAGHWSRKDADPVTGQYKDGDTMAQAKWVEANGVDPTWNVGHSIVFRLTVKKSTDDSAPASGPVTVTQGTPRAARTRSRGNTIINK